MNESTIPGRDRLQALLRIPQFKEDLNKVASGTQKQKAKLKRLFTSKYNVTYELARHLAGGEPSLLGENRQFLNNIFNGGPVEIIPSWMALEAAEPYIPESHIYNLREERYLTINIDLSKNRSEILSQVESIIDSAAAHNKENLEAFQYFNENRGTQKDFRFSIWTVYDLCSEKKTPNFTQVARSLSGRTGQARDDQQLSACLKAVKRAYRRACQIMTCVKTEINKEVDV
ncbi:MAG: hypothetical protein E3K32_11840 [wastewater metagenome]|nr:hypothetical protein [Candidatus Loosdrechtia aerotolerans]